MGMDRTISNFIRALRNADVRVSTAETLDAISAVELVGYSDKEHLKRSLSMVLPKTADEKVTFDAWFVQCFRFHVVRGDVTNDSADSTEQDGEESGEGGDGEGGGLAVILKRRTAAEKVQIQGQKEQSVRRGRGGSGAGRGNRRPLATGQIVDGEFPGGACSIHG